MNNYNQFINEIMSLEIRISLPENVYNLEYYRQFVRIFLPPEDDPELFELLYYYPGSLNISMEHALTDVLTLNDNQINKQIVRLQLFQSKLREFKDFYSLQKNEYYQNVEFDYKNFIYNLSNFFIISFPDGKIDTKLTDEFMYDLRHATQYKEYLIQTFLEKIKSVINPSATPTEKRNNLSYFVHNYQEIDISASKTTFCKVPFIGSLIDANTNISKNILDAYYDLIKQPKSNKSNTYNNKFNNFNNPFQDSLYGTYPLMSDLKTLHRKLDNFISKYGTLENNTKKNFRRTFEIYAKGFQYGFDKFYEEKINTSTSLSNSETIKAQKVFDFLNSSIHQTSFPQLKKDANNILSDWYKCGVDAGYFYFAWYLIFENHKLFEPYFNTQKQRVKPVIDSSNKEKLNPLPPILPSTLKTLPPIENVYFVHYQCDDFEESIFPQITNLCIYDNIDVIIFNNNEANAIEAYCQKVNELNKRGLSAIHWNQNRPNYGPDHIKNRYKNLTGKEIYLDYSGSLNLADYLPFKYGENYVPHKRLNSLAKLNGFTGDFETESANNTYASNRILLISKIYLSELKGSLKIDTISDSKLDLASSQTSVIDSTTINSDLDALNIDTPKSAKNEDDQSVDICKVPSHFEVLRTNLNISANILDAYFGQVPQPQNQKDVPESYIGKLHRYNCPFQVSVYGAFPLMIDWEGIEYSMNNVNDASGYYKHYTRDNVFNAMKDYARGFQYGFDNFLKDKVNNALSLSDSETMKVQKVLDFMSSPSRRGGFTESHGKGRNIFEKWYDCGVKGGYLYFAWYLIFENHILFDPHFKKIIKHDGSQNNTMSNTVNHSINSNSELILPLLEKNSNDDELSIRIKNSISEHLGDFKTNFQTSKDFDLACSILQDYFENKEVTISKPLFIKKGNKLKLGRELGELYQKFKIISISMEYLLLLKQLFTIYQDEIIDDKKINYTNLYKYLTNKS